VRDEGEEGLAGWHIDAYPLASETDAIYPDAGTTGSGPDGSFRMKGLDDSWPTWQFDAQLWQASADRQYYKLMLPQPLSFTFEDHAFDVDVPVAFADDTQVTFRVWEDFDGDGQVSGGDEIALWQDVVVEAPDGTHLFDLSGQAASATLTGLFPGQYVARATSGAVNRVPFTVVEGLVQAPVQLLMRPRLTFYGYVYDDANENSIRDPGEAGLGMAMIGIDAGIHDGVIFGGGRYTEPDGSYVLVEDMPPFGTETYVGCSYTPFTPPEEQDSGGPRGYWRGTAGMTPGSYTSWLLSNPVTITEGVYRYPVDCGLAYQLPPSPVFVSPPVAGPSTSLPPAGSGSGGGSGVRWPAPALAGIGALLIAWAIRAKGKRPDPRSVRPPDIAP
jgi:hypothetical protein